MVCAAGTSVVREIQVIQIHRVRRLLGVPAPAGAYGEDLPVWLDKRCAHRRGDAGAEVDLRYPVDAETLVAAGGRYMMDAAQLAKFRAGIAAERSGAELTKIVAGLRAKGYDVEGQELKRVPPPHPQDHPRGELLRHKRLIYWKRWPIEPWIATAAARERIAKVWRDGAELNAWLGRHLESAK